MTARRITVLAIHAVALLLRPLSLAAQERERCQDAVPSRLWVDSGHQWRPPFGLQRVGALPVVHVELAAESTLNRTYFVASYRKGRELSRRAVDLNRDPPPGQKTTSDIESPFFGTVPLSSIADEVALHARCAGQERAQQIVRQPVQWPAFEVAAIAVAEHRINPVDLGAILVPHDWLLLAGGEQAVIDVAAISRSHAIRGARLRAWFDEGLVTEVDIALPANRRVTRRLKLLPLSSNKPRGTLHVSVLDSDRELWSKQIPTMIVAQPPRWPAFGAVETKLRYDAPIAVNDPKTGDPRPAIDYSTAWDPKFKDVVVFLPNGSRFVFWRGASYVPFWAGRDNIGIGYQFAENLSHPIHHTDGSIDYAEPIKDFELRYGSVEILESTQSRVHVRWSYQGTDFDYNVTGDQAIEDVYFYPDGFGTRALTVTSAPNPHYELTEFIIVTPQAAFPLEAIPNPTIDILSLDGKKTQLELPAREKAGTAWRPHVDLTDLSSTPSVYRIRPKQNDGRGAIYFGAQDPAPSHAYAPIYQRGEIVTPAFWGSHWPLSRRWWLGWGAVDDSIYAGPAHNSLITWLTREPAPLATSSFTMPDTTGRAREMVTRRWAWLIADTDTDDDDLIDWAHSFSAPPSLHVTGARLDFPAYSPERRALRLIVDTPTIDIELKPTVRTVNPVFEFEGAPRNLRAVSINGQSLPPRAYAWDGSTLWLNASVGAAGARIHLQFETPTP